MTYGRQLSGMRRNLGSAAFSLTLRSTPQHPDYAGVARDGAEIHFFRMKIDPARSDWMCYLRVARIEELYEEFSGREVIHPNGSLEAKPWGRKELAVLDLNGALLRFGEAAGASSPQESDPQQ